MAVYRRLAEAAPAYLPNLVTALNDLANVLSAAGQRKEALTAIGETLSL